MRVNQTASSYVASGALLRNGATCVAFKPYNRYDPSLVVLLAQWEGQWVTWACDRETGICEWGHYFPTFDEALVDFNQRGVQPGEVV